MKLEPLSPMARMAREAAEQPVGRLDSTGRLTDDERSCLLMLVSHLESTLA